MNTQTKAPRITREQVREFVAALPSGQRIR